MINAYEDEEKKRLNELLGISDTNKVNYKLPPVKKSDIEGFADVEALKLKNEEDKRLSGQLTNLAFDKGSVGAGGTFNYKIPFDKKSGLEAQADIEAKKNKGQRMRLTSPMFSVAYNKNFKQGGKVKSASARADGIAQRGKTKGRMV